MIRLFRMNIIRKRSVCIVDSQLVFAKSCSLCNHVPLTKLIHVCRVLSRDHKVDLNSQELLNSEFNVNASLSEGVIKYEEIEDFLDSVEDSKDGAEESDFLTSDITTTSNNAKRKNNGMKKAKREMTAKVKISELEKCGKEKSLNQGLSTYLELCVSCGFLNRGFSALQYYVSRKSDIRISSVDVFNSLMDGYAKQGKSSKLLEVWSLMENSLVDPSTLSFIYRIESIVRSNKPNRQELLRETFLLMEKMGLSLDQILSGVRYKGKRREFLLAAIREIYPNFIFKQTSPELDYTSSLVNHLNLNSTKDMSSPAENLITEVEVKKLFKNQLDMELLTYLNIRSIEKTEKPSEMTLYYRKKLEELKEKWSKNIMDALTRDLNTMNLAHKNIHLSNKQLSIYPYLFVLDKKTYRDIVLHEIRKLAEGSETFSPSVSQLYRELGSQVKLRYEMKLKCENGDIDKISEIYGNYIKWYLNPSCSLSKNSRQEWMTQMNKLESNLDCESSPWSYTVLHAIGKFLYNIILRDIKIDVNIFRQNYPPHMLPGFYPVFRYQGGLTKEEIKPHPILSRLFRAAQLPYLTFSVSDLPMVTPPVPWSSLYSGGYIVSKTNLIRLPHQAIQQWERLKEAPKPQLYPSFDSLNQLGSIPWIVNKKVLDIVIEVFNTGGSSKLDIAEPPSSCQVPDPMPFLEGRSEKFQAYRQRMQIRRRKAELYSLWCDTLYRLSLANHFRDRIFWLPYNMDFRGRVYPCPPHLNHLGSDMARSLLKFALGKPLGPKGLDWLKIHLVNLTGLKKKDSIDARLEYANSLMEDILDSARDPLHGKKWWMESEEPWQTLACCLEIAEAVACPRGPHEHICHFPVHQDGSCNGLQHYAALGRDTAGAYSVNLSPAPLPQDVYTCVSALVEKEREKDAENGVKVAQVLDGFVKRKVIKQTVMTTVYGVTRFGARLQIAKQLKDIEEFPKMYVWPASTYLVSKTFASLREMFTSTREIQDWFTECARMISQVCGQNVEYVTPLGLPVVQPYYKFKMIEQKKSSLRGNISENYHMDMFERPNVMKQKNAFPPNFIHSLDSTHMMLTSLHCERAGITFVSVHDCYWTHPSTVSIMNQICREQFISLHSEPILQDLSDFLLAKFGYSDISGDSEAVIISKKSLNTLLSSPPPTGDFNLSDVLHSVYFFS